MEMIEINFVIKLKLYYLMLIKLSKQKELIFYICKI